MTSSVSSQVNHVPQGVGPPAQLLDVPARLTACDSRRRARSTTSVVVPPVPCGS